MRKRKLVGVALSLVAVLVASLITSVGKLPAQPDKGHAALGKGQRAKEFVEAFNRGDARAIAGFWAPDAEYVDQAGGHFKGRAAIEKLYAKTFAERKGMK